jgi:hypothetical protein
MQCSFSAGVPILALDESLLFHAVIALSAMHVSQTTAPSARAIAETYHRRCIRQLIDLDPEDALIERGVALAVTCLLRSYEILAGEMEDYLLAKHRLLIVRAVQKTTILTDTLREHFPWHHNFKTSSINHPVVSFTPASGTICARTSPSVYLETVPLR